MQMLSICMQLFRIIVNEILWCDLLMET